MNLVKVWLLFLLLSSHLALSKVIILSDDPADEFLLHKRGSLDIASDSYRLLFKHLPEFSMEIQIAPIARVNSILSSEETVCAINRIKTPERSLTHLYSHPVHLYPSHRLYFFKNETALPKKIINEDGELISLSALMYEFPNAVLAKEASRSYGPLLDEQLALIDKSRLLNREGGDAYHAMVAMFERKRANFLIIYPTTFKQHGSIAEREDIGSIAIANHPSFIAGHIACTKTAESLHIIQKINHTLLSLYPSSEYLQLHLKHIPKSEHELLRRRIADLFLQYKQ
ncbi:hypothetical protein PALB_20810 [Pseudoalteromonas luteoviolacea B = ATCC 29581]|nr:hypothetical protein PALB_20810 [Pseudoalteromonas luteoviolacea B = ATCC 29581]